MSCTVPAVPTQEAFPEETDTKKQQKNLCLGIKILISREKDSSCKIFKSFAFEVESQDFDPCLDHFNNRYVITVNDDTFISVKSFPSSRQNVDHVRKFN